ncbi:MAG: hypothetical protein ACJAVT_002258 [Yoonia sp.]
MTWDRNFAALRYKLPTFRCKNNAALGGTLAHIVMSNAIGTPMSRNCKGYCQPVA